MRNDQQRTTDTQVPESPERLAVFFKGTIYEHFVFLCFGETFVLFLLLFMNQVLMGRISKCKTELFLS